MSQIKLSRTVYRSLLRRAASFDRPSSCSLFRIKPAHPPLHLDKNKKKFNNNNHNSPNRSGAELINLPASWTRLFLATEPEVAPFIHSLCFYFGCNQCHSSLVQIIRNKRIQSKRPPPLANHHNHNHNLNNNHFHINPSEGLQTIPSSITINPHPHPHPHHTLPPSTATPPLAPLAQTNDPALPLTLPLALPIASGLGQGLGSDLGLPPCLIEKKKMSDVHNLSLVKDLSNPIVLDNAFALLRVLTHYSINSISQRSDEGEIVYQNHPNNNKTNNNNFDFRQTDNIDHDNVKNNKNSTNSISSNESTGSPPSPSQASLASQASQASQPLDTLGPSGSSGSSTLYHQNTLITPIPITHNNQPQTINPTQSSSFLPSSNYTKNTNNNMNNNDNNSPPLTLSSSFPSVPAFPPTRNNKTLNYRVHLDQLDDHNLNPEDLEDLDDPDQDNEDHEEDEDEDDHHHHHQPIRRFQVQPAQLKNQVLTHAKKFQNVHEDENEYYEDDEELIDFDDEENHSEFYRTGLEYSFDEHLNEIDEIMKLEVDQGLGLVNNQTSQTLAAKEKAKKANHHTSIIKTNSTGAAAAALDKQKFLVNSDITGSTEKTPKFDFLKSFSFAGTNFLYPFHKPKSSTSHTIKSSPIEPLPSHNQLSNLTESSSIIAPLPLALSSSTTSASQSEVPIHPLIISLRSALASGSLPLIESCINEIVLDHQIMTGQISNDKKNNQAKAESSPFPISAGISPHEWTSLIEYACENSDCDLAIDVLVMCTDLNILLPSHLLLNIMKMSNEQCDVICALIVIRYLFTKNNSHGISKRTDLPDSQTGGFALVPKINDFNFYHNRPLMSIEILLFEKCIQIICKQAREDFSFDEAPSDASISPSLSSSHGHCMLAMELYMMAIQRFGRIFTAATFDSLIYTMANVGWMNDANWLLHQARHFNLLRPSMYRSLMWGYCMKEDIENALKLIKTILDDKLQPEPIVLHFLIVSCLTASARFSYKFRLRQNERLTGQMNNFSSNLLDQSEVHDNTILNSVISECIALGVDKTILLKRVEKTKAKLKRTSNYNGHFHH